MLFLYQNCIDALCSVCIFSQETMYPSYMLDLMVLCWSQSPRDRPSASQIVSIASAPEFTHLCDTVSLNHPAPVVASAVVPIPEIGGKCYYLVYEMCRYPVT